MKFIDYSSMSATEKLEFNRTGKCADKYVLKQYKVIEEKK